MKKISFLCALALLLALALSSCGQTELHAVLLNDNAKTVDGEAFAARYTPLTFTYPAFSGSIEDKDNAFGYLVLNTKEDYDAVFPAGAGFEADLTRETVVIYAFTAIYIRPMTLEKLTIKDGKLEVALKMQKNSGGAEPIADATAPFQRYVVFKLDKAEFTGVSITIE